jgi:ferredoxin
VVLTSGEVLPADTVVVSVGDVLEPGFLPSSLKLEKGFVSVDDNYQTTDPRIFAIGDAVKPGLITEAIGAGKRVSQVIDDILKGKRPRGDKKAMIDRQRIKLEYYDPRYVSFEDIQACADECASCGSCRDCGVCIAVCPQQAISKQEDPASELELVVDPERCIGCGFCVAACPCGIWELVENEPLV